MLRVAIQQQSAASHSAKEDNRQSEIDEATLLKDWDFARFFPNKFQSQKTTANADSSSTSTSSASAKIDAKSAKEKSNAITHRRAESDLKVSNPFLRGFRRENSDFFPMSPARHSAIFVDRNVNPLRSSGIFNNRRGSDASITGLAKRSNGEPVLTDFITKTNSDSPSSSGSSDNAKDYNALKSIGLIRGAEAKLDFLRPRREKTESDIVLRSSAARQGLRDNLEARRKEMESKFSREADDMRRRNSRPIDINSTASVASPTQSIDAGEYLYLQVNGLVLFTLTYLVSQSPCEVLHIFHFCY